MKKGVSTSDLKSTGSRSPYFSIPPMIRNASTFQRPSTAGAKKKINAQARIAQLEGQVDQLIKSKWSMEDIHSCIIKRMHEEIVRLGGKKSTFISSGSNNTEMRLLYYIYFYYASSIHY